MNRVRLFREILYFLIFAFLVTIVLLLDADVRMSLRPYPFPSQVLSLMIIAFTVYGPMRFFLWLFRFAQKLRVQNEEKIS